jgi:protein SCO1/2
MRRLALLLPLALVLAGCGSSSSKDASSSDTQSAPAETTTVAKAAFAAPGVLDPAQQAPPVVLADQDGRRTSLAEFRGKAVMITFVYSHCPDTCPLIMQALGAAKRSLGKRADELQIVAVSVDPKGDTPRAVKRFLAQRRLTGKVHYLLGTRKQLATVWVAWHITSRAAASDPEQIEHSSAIYGIDGSGMIRTLYPASPLDPKAIVHDVPLLVEA